jgi:uncharacterized protein
MAANDLSVPGSPGAGLYERVKRVRLLRGLLIGVALALIFALGWVVVTDDPLGGEPVAIIALDRPAQLQVDSGEVLGIRPTVDSTEAEPLPPGQAEPPADIVIIDPLVAAAPHSVATDAALTSGLLEAGRHGLLPIISADGRRPADAYAQRSAAVSPGATRIALVIGGMGLSTRATEAAIDRLPPQVTLAFAPYGDEVTRLTDRARQAGHELALQLPLEPYDYPNSDPGPNTLLTGLDIEQNRDRLHWAMSRFVGYVGLLNYMGARFTASDQALRPILAELRDRGLIYLDDGSSPRSLAGAVSGEVGLPFARADMVVDAVPSRQAITAALDRLAGIARNRGIAVGVATGLPESVDAIAEWVQRAQSEGITLVPMTAAVGGGDT